MRSDRNIQIIVSGGGTGGHFYPAMAIAEALTKVEPNYPLPGHLAIHYIGSKFGMETKLLSEYNFSNTLLPIRGFQRYKSIFALKENIKFPLRVLLSLNRVQQVFRQIRPDAV